MRRLLVLRPESGAGATLDRARRRGLEAVAVPLFEIVPIAWELPEDRRFDGLLLTSANAIVSAGDRLEGLRALPVYAVGDATAKAAREAGFTVLATGNGGVDRLLETIPAGLELLHLCGEDRRQVTRPRQRITSIPVYAARAIEKPDLESSKGAVVLIHSPRTGQRFSSLVADRRSTWIAAISPAAAEAVGTGWEGVEIAERPTDDALLALAARLCNKLAPK